MRKFPLLLLLTTFSIYSQKSGSTCEVLSKINKLIEIEHYKPKPIDDSLSVYVFDTFINQLDSDRNLFTKSEYEKLSKHRLSIDNSILNGDCTFLNDFVLQYKLGLERKKRILEKIQITPLNYQSKDSVNFTKKQLPFDVLESQLDKILNKRIRLEILKEISEMSSNIDSLKKNFLSIEKIIKAKTLDNNLCKINNILNSKSSLETTLQKDFLNIFCAYFDPHSNYFNLDAKSSFISMLSTSNLSLGLTLELNEKQEIIVTEIIPGGPAAESEKFEKEDVIVKVSNKKGDEYWVSCASMETIGEMIFSDANKELELTVRKKNGTLNEVSLKKQVLKVTNNNVFSFIAEKEIRVGYIKIPSFYSDLENKSVQGCADDVAKEIVKLQQDNIAGLVIDLQDNGGGSMEEAIKLVGMFIDYGPISVLVDNKNRQNIVKDMNRGSVYNGAIVLLINGRSASASEFFSAALQDYNRAFVIGSTSLGKATMQTILPLDKNDQKDFAKLTVEKFYRITGDSNQIKGVIPDINLPIVFNDVTKREKSFRTAIEYDSITTKARFQKYPSLNNAKVISLSQERTKINDTFKEIEKINIEINKVYNIQKKPYLLVLENVFKDTYKNKALWDRIKIISEKASNCTIDNTSYDKDKIQFDPFQQEINTYKIKDVATNPYLEEAIQIIKDYNNLKL